MWTLFSCLSPYVMKVMYPLVAQRGLLPFSACYPDAWAGRVKATIFMGD
jgi:hypothetical protein